MKFLILISSVVLTVVLIYSSVMLIRFNFEFLSSKDLVKIPILTNTYLTKIKNNTWKNNTDTDIQIFFKKYIAMMESKGWKYSEEDRMGQMIVFKKEEKKIGIRFPRFIGVKF